MSGHSKYSRRSNSRYSRNSSNSRPVSRYSNSQASHENTTRKLMVHQTSPEFAASILTSKRFLPSTAWDQVGSIYFAETVPETENKAQHKGTYLMADVYLGRYTGNDTIFNESNSNLTSIRHEKGTHSEGLEYIIKDPERALNIRYLDGVKPSGITVEMRDRMPLIYATSAQKAAEIIKTQKIPKENRADIAGNGYYLWENIPDARKYQINGDNGAETFLVADVHFPYCYQSQSFPNKSDYYNYKTFRGDYQDTHYYMVKNPYYIVHIKYIAGTLPPETL